MSGDPMCVNPRLKCEDCEEFVYLTWPRGFKRGAFMAECDCRCIRPREEGHPEVWVHAFR